MSVSVSHVRVGWERLMTGYVLDALEAANAKVKPRRPTLRQQHTPSPDFPFAALDL